MVGLGELLARLERRRQLLAAEGLFAPERKRPLPFLPGCVGLVTAPGSAAERDVLENAGAAGRRSPSRSPYAAMQGPRAAAEVIEAVDRLDRDPRRRRDRGRPRRRLGRGPAAVLRRGPGPRRPRRRHPVVSAIGHEPDPPLLDLVADVRASTPTDAAKLVSPTWPRSCAGRGRPRPAPLASPPAWLAREQAGLDALRSRRPSGRPARRWSTRAPRWSTAARPRPPLARPRARPRRRRPRPPARPGPRPVPLATLRRGYAVLQDADGHVVTRSPAAATEGAAVAIRVVRRPYPRTDHRRSSPMA